MNILNVFLDPKSIAVAGVSKDVSKIGRVIYDRLMEKKKAGLLNADVFAVSVSLKELDGQRVYGGFSEIEREVDLAVIAVPAQYVPDLVLDAGRSGVKAAVVVSGGFSETGDTVLDKKLKEVVEKTGLRVLGPNTIGVLNPYTGVETFFTVEFKPFSDGRPARTIAYPPKGNVAVVSQSGALAYYIIDSFGERGVGLRAAVCVGNQIDVDVAEVVEFFSEDDLTSVLAVYIEGVSDGRKFLNTVLKARRAGKHVVVLKAGRTKAGEKAAYTHTASMVGDWETFAGALRQSGAIVARTVREMVDVAFAASLQRQPKNRRTFVLSNAGGFSVMASDLAQELGLEVSRLPEDVVAVVESLKKAGKMPSIVVADNPLDLSGSANPDAFEEAYKAVAGSGFYGIHLLMPFHIPPAVDESVVWRLAKTAKDCGATVVACDVGGSDWAVRFRKLFVENGIPAYHSVEDAVQTLSLYIQAHTPTRSHFQPYRPTDGQHHPIPRQELNQLLKAYGLETASEQVVYGEDEALEAAEKLRYPVVMKIASAKIPHKSDVGGVVAGLDSGQSVSAAFRRLSELARRLGVEEEGVVVQETVKGVEMLLGSKIDKFFGPVAIVGFGGVFTELLRDFITFVAPLEESESMLMINTLKHQNLLKGFRAYPAVDTSLLAKTITQFSRIPFENPAIKQLEINPLIVYRDQAKAVDVRGLKSANT
ncbi:MAG: acetate--CoA ligase family protein [Candidatus Caldarchaeum sp.]|nr:acetate--CoA ligase family protein [Candidatus Caldarchaeum sp.]